MIAGDLKHCFNSHKIALIPLAIYSDTVMLHAMSNENKYEFIDTPELLGEFCRLLENQAWIAVDTEFHRDQNYYPDLCLVQIGTAELSACIDPLKITDLTPLLNLFYNPDIVKVMHAGRQDLEIFYHMRGEVPQPIFDTQVAAPLLGLDEQMGYGALVKALLNVDLDKSHSRADWMRRPMPVAQIRYALDDVVYLAQIYPKMLSQLQKQDRLAWLKNDFDTLTSVELYQNPPEKAWRRIRAANKLKPRQLSVLQALAGWREETAQKQNRPRNWVCKDDVLIDMSKLMPGDPTELSHIRGVGEGFSNRYGKTIIELINQAQEKKPEALPNIKFKQKLTASESALLDALSAIVSLCAEDNNLHPSAIASRKNIEALFRGDPDSELLHGWRKQIAGDTLQSFLAGEIKIGVKGKRLSLS